MPQERSRLTDLFRHEIFDAYSKSDEYGMIFTYMWAFDSQGDWDYINKLNYAIGWAEKTGFDDIAEDIQKHYGISKGIQNHIDELTPKQPIRNKSYGHSL